MGMYTRLVVDELGVRRFNWSTRSMYRHVRVDMKVVGNGGVHARLEILTLCT